MSSSNPPFSFYFDSLLTDFNRLHRELLKYPFNLSVEAMDQSLIKYHKRLKVINERSQNLQSDNLAQLVDEAISFLRAKEVSFETDPEIIHMDSKDILLKDVAALKAHLCTFKDLYNHRSEIEDKGLLHLAMKGEPYAVNEIVTLVTQGNEWAKIVLEEKLTSNHPKAFFIMLECLEIDVNAFAYEKFLSKPQLNELLQSCSEGDLNKVLPILPIALKNYFNENLWQSFAAHVAEENEEALLAFNRLFHLKDDPDAAMKDVGRSVVENFLIDHLKAGKEWALYALDAYLLPHRFQSDLAHPFVLKLINTAKNNEFVLDLLLALVVIHNGHRAFCSLVEDHLQNQSFAPPFEDATMGKVIPVIDPEFQNVKYRTQSTPKEFVRWDAITLTKQIELIRLSATRLKKLISMTLKKEIDFSEDNPITPSCFPKIKRVLCGISPDRKGQVRPLLHQLDKILAQYGIKLEIILPAIGAEPLGKDTTQHLSLQPRYEWVRDVMIVCRSTVLLPPIIAFESFFDDAEMLRIQQVDKRETTIFSQAAAFETDIDHVLFGRMGLVNSCCAQLSAYAALDLKADSCQVGITYNEGGNYLAGRFNGKTFVIIGKDSLEVSRKKIEDDLIVLGLRNKDGRFCFAESDPETTRINLTDEDMRSFYTHDLNLDPSCIYFCQQPNFHLDCASCILPQKEGDAKPCVAINDSKACLALLKEYRSTQLSSKQKNSFAFIQRLKEWEKKLENIQQFEDAASRDLKKQGFEVKRVAGTFENVFTDNPALNRVNFFNHVSFETDQGQRVILAMDCEDFFKRAFEKFISENMGQNITIHYLSRECCERLMRRFGGLHCITQLFEN